MLIHRIASGLHHKNINSANVLEQLKVHFAIGKSLQLGFTDLDADMLANGLCELGVGRAAEELESLVLAQIARLLALRRRSLLRILTLCAFPGSTPGCATLLLLRAWFARLLFFRRHC